jgi:hypothetical protein
MKRNFLNPAYNLNRWNVRNDWNRAPALSWFSLKNCRSPSDTFQFMPTQRTEEETNEYAIPVHAERRRSILNLFR